MEFKETVGKGKQKYFWVSGCPLIFSLVKKRNLLFDTRGSVGVRPKATSIFEFDKQYVCGQ